MFSFRYIFLLLAIPLCTSAQRYSKNNWEISGFLGATNYLGDMAPDLAMNETRPALGLGVRRNFNSYISLVGELNCGWIAGNDSNFESLKYRGLSFRSNILDVTGQMEFNFFRFGSGPRDSRFTPYVFTGLSFFKFNPKADYGGDTYYLQRMSTEGQALTDSASKKYSLLQFAIPIGAGVKFKLQESWNLSVHVAYNGTFTDYLDDVSGQYVDNDLLVNKAGTESAALADPNHMGRAGKQRGNPYINDWFIFAGVSLSYVLPGHICYTF
jgi:hypothetical protein